MSNPLADALQSMCGRVRLPLVRAYPPTEAEVQEWSAAVMVRQAALLARYPWPPRNR